MIHRVVSFWLLLCCVAHAQVGQIPAWPPNQPAAAASTYTGPGDVVATGWFAWWGLRAFSAAKAAATANVGIFRRSSDSTTCTGKLATSGDLDLTTAYCSGTTNLPTFCAASAGSCFVDTLYDQSGGTNCSSSACDMVEAGTSTEPALTFNCLNTSKPCMTFTPTNYLQSGADATSSALPTSITAVVQRTTSTANQAYLSMDAAAQDFTGYFTTSGNAACTNGVVLTASASDAAPHAIQCLFGTTTGNSAINVDGSDTASANAGTGDLLHGVLVLGGLDGSVFLLNGFIAEAGILTTASTPTTRGNMHTNQSAYWGTP